MKIKIIFVDDEEKILEGIKRSLWDMREIWDMEFELSGKEAIEAFKKNKFDVIVTDMRMPNMSGLELLTIVKDLYPETVRIILSGYSDQDIVIKSIELTHRYLSKPCDIGLLKSVIEKSTELRNLLKNEKLRQLISKIHTIPSLSRLYQRLLAEISIKDFSLDRIGEIIKQDIGMSAKMLQIVNSAFFGINKKITDITESVKLIGIEVIKSLVLSLDIFSKYEDKMLPGFSIDKLLNHSIICANYTRDIAVIEKMNNDTISNSYMAGMLHDIGLLLIAANLPDKYREILNLIKKEKITFFEAEQKILDSTHDELGGYLTKLWGLPDDIVEAVAFHHSPQKCPSKELTLLTCVHAGNCLYYIKYNDEQDDQYKSYFDEVYLNKLNLTGHIPVWKEKCFKIN